MTKQQRLILNIVSQSQAHLTADKIYLKAKRCMPNIAVGTIYRNLNQLVQENKVRRVSLSDNADRFDPNLSPHDHLICAVCGDVQDIKIPSLKDLLKSKTHCEIISFTLNISYICPLCETFQNSHKQEHHLNEA